MEKKNHNRIQAWKGLGLIVTGFMVLLATMIVGDIAFEYLNSSNAEMSHALVTALYILAFVVAIGWEVWLTYKGIELMEGNSKPHEAKDKILV
jgi:membrane protein CcdC involved in cytochrome C biogenesis